MTDVVPSRRKDDAVIAELREEVAQLRTLTEATAKNTAEIVEFWKTAQAGIKVLGWLGKIAKWVAVIAGGVTAVLAAIHAVKTGVAKV